MIKQPTEPPMPEIKKQMPCSFCSARDRYAGDCLWDLEHRGHRIIMDAVALNYCPMCGRKLWGEEMNDCF